MPLSEEKRAELVAYIMAHPDDGDHRVAIVCGVTRKTALRYIKIAEAEGQKRKDRKQVRALAMDIIETNPNLSDERVAKMVGSHSSTINAWRNENKAPTKKPKPDFVAELFAAYPTGPELHVRHWAVPVPDKGMAGTA